MSAYEHLPDWENVSDAREFKYGSLPSQYDTLDASTTMQLEQAALCCHMRDFQAALSALDAFPAEIRHHPVVAFEHSQVYWLEWSLLDCARILREALTWAEENRADVDEHGIYTLLRACLGKLEVYTRGDFTLARDAMREVNGWLSSISIEQYTDVQVFKTPGRNRNEHTSDV